LYWANPNTTAAKDAFITLEKVEMKYGVEVTKDKTLSDRIIGRKIEDV